MNAIGYCYDTGQVIPNPSPYLDREADGDFLFDSLDTVSGGSRQETLRLSTTTRNSVIHDSRPFFIECKKADLV